MRKVISVTPLEGHRLVVTFDDGLSGTISMRDRMFGPVFEPIRDEATFRQVFIDEFGVIGWPNGADLAPDALYDRLSSGGRAGTLRAQ